jgi:hypothetical protein
VRALLAADGVKMRAVDLHSAPGKALPACSALEIRRTRRSAARGPVATIPAPAVRTRSLKRLRVAQKAPPQYRRGYQIVSGISVPAGGTRCGISDAATEGTFFYGSPNDESGGRSHPLEAWVAEDQS